MNRGGTNSTHNLGGTYENMFRINNNKNKNKSLKRRATRIEAQK
jgi:hypothetical protein